MWLRNVTTDCYLDKEEWVEWSQLFCYFVGYLIGNSSKTFLEFCLDTQVFAILAATTTVIELTMATDTKAGSDTSLEFECKSTHVYHYYGYTVIRVL
jgi:hypothetical protein